MELKEGVMVRVAFDPKYKIIDGSRKFNGMDLVITKRKAIKVREAKEFRLRGVYYELEGAETQQHMPYGFLEENLVPLV